MNFSRIARFSAAAAPQSIAKQVSGYILFGGLVSGTAGLGAWQIQRYVSKVEMIEKRQEELRRPAAPFRQVLDEAHGTGVKATRRLVTVQGVWEEGSSILIGRRGAPKHISGGTQGLAVAPSGYYLCTPLILEDGERVIINRGWMPASVADAKAWNSPGKESIVEVTGVLAYGDRGGYFAPENNPSSGTMMWLELPVLGHFVRATLFDGEPILIEAIDRTSSERKRSNGTWPKPHNSTEGLVVFPVMPETHAVYALTWCSLSLFGLIASRRILFKPPRRLSAARRTK